MDSPPLLLHTMPNSFTSEMIGHSPTWKHRYIWNPLDGERLSCGAPSLCSLFALLLQNLNTQMHWIHWFFPCDSGLAAERSSREDDGRVTMFRSLLQVLTLWRKRVRLSQKIFIGGFHRGCIIFSWNCSLHKCKLFSSHLSLEISLSLCFCRSNTHDGV